MRWLGWPFGLIRCVTLAGLVSTGLLIVKSFPNQIGLHAILDGLAPVLALTLFWLTIALLCYTVLVLIKNAGGEWAHDVHLHRWKPIVHSLESYLFKAGLLLFGVLYAYIYVGYELSLLPQTGPHLLAWSWLASSLSFYVYYVVSKLLGMRFV